MKIKTSVTLSPAVAKAIDHLAGRDGTRSAVVERAVLELVARLDRQAKDARDLEILNGNAARLNDEAEDVLSYQVDA